jgi:uncharacterized membrane protein YeaQ/YmgE (transglycosylase-associated protein family)
MITGGIAGWMAAILIRGAGYGVVINIVLGVIGGLLGGALLDLLGIGSHGWLLDLATAVAGAMLLLALAGLVRRAAARSP